MSIPVSQFIPPPPPPSPAFPFGVHTCVLYICVSISALQTVHLYHFCRFHIYVLIYDICFSISDLFRSLQSTEQSSWCYTVGSHQLSILYIVSIVYICQSPSPNSSHSPLPLWYPYICSLHLCLYFCFAKRSSILFFQISHICTNI